jgi:peptide methionine sulfoxide reductase msrA/msrB
LLWSTVLVLCSNACGLRPGSEPIPPIAETALADASDPAPAPDPKLASSTDNPTTPMPTVKVHVFDRTGQLRGPIAMPKVVKTEAQWRAQLTPEQFEIARGAGTERPFCGNLLDNKQQGVYACVCCSLPLFGSQSKFHSGTGWPSFFQPIAPANVLERSDESHGMVRTEILCARCDGHLGHVFEDGPRPTGLRYCVNSESLTFVGEGELGSLADPSAEAPPGASQASGGKEARVVFAGGCFWCVEAVFEELEGVLDAVSGYAGGSKETANYKAVCNGTTGHAEAVQIVYDPSKIRFEDLLRVFFATHDPTTRDRQGNDVGPQYRSAIFFASDEEQQLAQAMIADLTEAKAFARPIVTTLEPLTEFFPAEEYHQGYVCANPSQPYVRAVALPKVEKVRKQFADKLKGTSPLAR